MYRDKGSPCLMPIEDRKYSVGATLTRIAVLKKEIQFIISLKQSQETEKIGVYSE